MNDAWISAIAMIGSALVGAVTSIIVCVVNNNKQNALILYRINELEKKQDKHNNLIERTYRLEEQAAIHEEKIAVANHRISDLEKNTGGR